MAKVEEVTREKYSESQLEDLARDVYDQTVNVLGMEMDALYILKHLDEPAYAEILNGLQEDETVFICSECQSEYEDEDEAQGCAQDHNAARIAELEEMKQEYILNESVFADDHPSWGEVAEASAAAESKWEETVEGKELKSLLEESDET